MAKNTPPPNAGDIRAAADHMGADLREVYGKLQLIDRSNLSADQKVAWRDDFLGVLGALEKYENATLAGIVQKMKAEAVPLQAATAKLVADLHGIEEAAVIIKAVGAGLGVITRIATLL